MALIRYTNPFRLPDPFQEMARLQREMDRLFADVMGRGPAAWVTSGVFPAFNVWEDTERIYVEAELPGVKPEDLEISVERNTVTLRGERKPEATEGVSYHRRERRTGRFDKALSLPCPINAEAVEARCENGVLRLTLPKAEEAKPKKIEIKSS